MAINRNAYTSLLESVTEAVANPMKISQATTPKGAVRKGKSPTAATRMSRGASGKLSGDALSRSLADKSPYLASGDKVVNTNQLSAGRAKGYTTTTTTAAQQSGWGGANVGGARNAEELSRWLASQGKGTSTVAGPESSPVGKPLVLPTSSGKSKSKKPSVAGSRIVRGSLATVAGGRKSGGTSRVALSTVADSVEWDEIDEILVEGLETYGEDGLEEILAHFAETGELSEELAELLDAGNDELDEVIAEGLELYGEEGLEAILADFAETGELSEELAELIEANRQDQ